MEKCEVMPFRVECSEVYGIFRSKLCPWNKGWLYKMQDGLSEENHCVN